MAPPPAHVGATRHLTSDSGSGLDITLDQIINPATGEQGPPTDDDGKPNGGTYVAAMLTIKNTGTTAVQDDANNDAAMVGSNDEDYATDLHTVKECTNFDDGIYRLDPGESERGCVVFVLPKGVTPARFKFTPSAGFALDFGEWLIP